MTSGTDRPVELRDQPNAVAELGLSLLPLIARRLGISLFPKPSSFLRASTRPSSFFSFWPGRNMATAGRGDGITPILPGTSLACAIPSSSSRIVYYQDAQGGIREAVNSAEWKGSGPALFQAKLLSPLAAVAPADGDEVNDKIRIYSLSEQNLLQEWCYSMRDGWHLGELGELKIQPAANSSVAATQWDDNGTTQIRVYYQGAQQSVLSMANALPNSE
jgi:hypothetical protein